MYNGNKKCGISSKIDDAFLRTMLPAGKHEARPSVDGRGDNMDRVSHNNVTM